MLKMISFIGIILFFDMISWYFLVPFSLKAQELPVGSPSTRKSTKNIIGSVNYLLTLQLFSPPTSFFSYTILNLNKLFFYELHFVTYT